MKLIVVADLHAEFLGLLVGEKLTQFARRLSEATPDVVILAGDIASGEMWSPTLTALRDAIPDGRRYVIAGNHDLWVGHYDYSNDGKFRGPIEKFSDQLPTEAAEAGWIWAEEEIIRIGSVAIVCSIAWYDYRLSPDPRRAAALKQVCLNDYKYIDKCSKEWRDDRFVEERNRSVEERLDQCAADPTVDRIIVVTHIPAFAEQRVREPSDDEDLDGAFYDISLGEIIRGYSKVTDVVSGHTHRGIDTVVEREEGRTIRAQVIGSKYGRPAFVEINL